MPGLSECFTRQPGVVANRVAFHMVRGFVGTYRVLFGWITHGRCRFEPSCSQYCIDAFGSLHALEAFKKALLRLLKCHPFHSGGYDPVLPERGQV